MTIRISISRFSLVFLISFFVFSSAQSQDDFSIVHGPYLVDPAEDAITVIWFTNKKATSWIEYSEYKESGTFPTWGGYPKIARASKDGLIDANVTRHIIRITGLKSATRYKYRINSKEILQFNPYEVIYGDVISGDFHTFSTLNPKAHAFSFGVLSDVHEDETIIYDLDKITPLKNYELLFFNGDILSWIGSEDRIFDGFLDASVETFASEKPIMYVRGNHETRGPGARQIMGYFPHESGKSYFALTHGEVRFLVMDCGEDKPDDHPVYAGVVDFDAYRSEQAQWLQEEISSSAFKSAAYRVVIFHIPAYSDSDWHGATDVTNKWGPILNRASVDLVINGHTHRFERIDRNEKLNNFPILITGRRQILDTQVGEESMTCTVLDTAGKIVDAFSIPRRKLTPVEDWRLGTSVGSIFKLTEEKVFDLAENHFTDVELGFGRVQSKEDLRVLQSKIKVAKKWLDKQDINVWSIHIPYGKSIDISLLDEEARKLAIEEVSTLIKAAKPLKPEKLVIHPSFEPIPEKERIERLAACNESLPVLLALAEKYDMKLCIEDLPRTCLGNTAAEINFLLAEAPGLEVCCDVNHLLQETTEAFIDAVGSPITTVHMSDYDGVDERHWIPGKGIIKWNKVLKSLELNGYTGPFLFESAGTLEEKAAVWEQLKSDYRKYQNR